jgi:transcription termination factor Rho
MTVLERSELQASSLSDLHAIADQLGLDGFRRLRKADLIDAILGDAPSPEEGSPAKRGRARGTRATPAGDDGDGDGDGDAEPAEEAPRRPERTRRRRLVRSRRGGASNAGASGAADESGTDDDGTDEPAPSARTADGGEDSPAEASVAQGVVELLGNGSAFLRVSPPDASDEDVYISAAQVRRCELVSGDRVTGPVRTPRRSERYPSLVRVDTINGAPADTVAGGTRYEELDVAYPTERLALGSSDPTLQAIEWLTPLGRGSRVVLTGAARAGKSETLRGLLDALAGRDELQITLVLVGIRPEEIAAWRDGPVAPAVTHTLASAPDTAGQAVERAVEEAKRLATRGGDAVVVIDSLDAVEAQVARRALAAARNLREGGSLTVIATATQPIGGETTVIALDAKLTSTGRQPNLDLLASGTIKPELLVGEDGARAIVRARAAAIEEPA